MTEAWHHIFKTMQMRFITNTTDDAHQYLNMRKGYCSQDPIKFNFQSAL